MRKTLIALTATALAGALAPGAGAQDLDPGDLPRAICGFVDRQPVIGDRVDCLETRTATTASDDVDELVAKAIWAVKCAGEALGGNACHES